MLLDPSLPLHSQQMVTMDAGCSSPYSLSADGI
jgi:hypothetical protein